MSAKGRKSRGGLKNFVQSNVHCQDESAVSPTFSLKSDSMELSTLSEVFLVDMESETLPSDWRSGVRIDPTIEKTPVSMDYLTSRITRICGSVLDENSQGSDSGLGHELSREQSASPKTQLAKHYRAKKKVLQEKATPLLKERPREQDDGFVEDCENLPPSELHAPGDACGVLCSSMSEKLDWNKDLSEACLSPFTLHRRNSVSGALTRPETARALTGRPLVPAPRPQAKRMSMDAEMEELSEGSPSVNTTPKRRKSASSLSLRRVLSSVQPLTAHRPPSTPTKRDAEPEDVEMRPALVRSVSEIPLPRMDEQKIGRSIEASDNCSLAGDGFAGVLLSKADRHRFELTTVPAESVAALIDRSRSEPDKFSFIDCRYPYEFAGGHLRGAVNLHTEEMVMEAVFAPALERSVRESSCCSRAANSITSDTARCLHSPLKCSRNHINQARTLVFYCEFSSRRAPDLARYLRSQDRKRNLINYPYLFYPDIYIMKGGYHEFQQHYLHLCEPAGYVKMFDKRFSAELTQHRRRTRKQRWPRGGHKVMSPSGHGVSPLRLTEISETAAPSPPSPPRLLEWS